LAYDSTGNPGIVFSYSDGTTGRSARFRCRDASGTWGPPFDHIAADGLGQLAKMSLAWQDDTPAFAYGLKNFGMPLVFCERPDGWSCTVLNPGSSGMWDWGFVSNPSVMVDSADTIIIGAAISGLNFEDELWLYRRPLGETEWQVERVRGFPVDDGVLDHDGYPVFSYRGADGIMFAYQQLIGCATTCDDGNPCTDDSCINGECSYTAVSDGLACGTSPNVCCCGACSLPWCSTDADCDDSDPCTEDVCMLGQFPCESFCEHTPIPNCGGCVPTHSKEKGPRCTDGLDNDCDGFIDGDDPDCQ
jgi:hypothetical protein